MAKYHSRARDSTGCASERVRLGSDARLVAAILAADVAGYSRLMGLDEVGTVRIETFGDVRSLVLTGEKRT